MKRIIFQEICPSLRIEVSRELHCNSRAEFSIRVARDMLESFQRLYINYIVSHHAIIIEYN